MSHLTVDRIRGILPDLDELRALTDELLSQSRPDPARQWAGSGALGTAGSRLVDPVAFDSTLVSVTTREQDHLEFVYSRVTEALALVAAGALGEATDRLLHAAAAEEGRDRPDRAAEYANAACRLAREAADGAAEALALRRRGRARRSSGRLGDAERDYERGHDLARAVGDDRGAAEAAIGAGNVLEDQGRWSEAERWYRKALALLNDGDRPVPEQWHALLNLHVVLRSTGALEASLEPLEEAGEIAGALNDPAAPQFLENARGQWLMASGRFEEAIDTLQTAIGSSTGARASVTIRLNLAEALFASGRRLDATEEIRRAEREALAAGVHLKLPEVYRLLGRIAVAEGNPDSFVLFERALDLIVGRKLPDLERAMTLQAYADGEHAVGDTESATALRAEADAIYRRLGIDRPRSEWADQFGMAKSDADPEKTAENL